MASSVSLGLLICGDYHWCGISKEGGQTPAQCAEYMHSLRIPTSLKRMAPALFTPLSMELVQGALKRQVLGASPGIDGFDLKIYQEFHEFFSVRMLEILQHAQEHGNFPDLEQRRDQVHPKNSRGFHG